MFSREGRSSPLGRRSPSTGAASAWQPARSRASSPGVSRCQHLVRPRQPHQGSVRPHTALSSLSGSLVAGGVTSGGEPNGRKGKSAFWRSGSYSYAFRKPRSFCVRHPPAQRAAEPYEQRRSRLEALLAGHACPRRGLCARRQGTWRWPGSDWRRGRGRPGRRAWSPIPC